MTLQGSALPAKVSDETLTLWFEPSTAVTTYEGSCNRLRGIEIPQTYAWP
jgi:hypothetical protein